MRVVGVGFGRTGTASMKLALERLGAGPCYHMSDILEDLSLAPAWRAAAESQRADWASLLAGFSSTMDWPAAAFWRELLDEYPQAKAILTVRDPQRWYDSMESTILRAWRRQRDQLSQPGAVPPAMRDYSAMIDAVVARRVFDGGAEDRESAVATYERHIAEVRASVPAHRLLDFEVSQGWEPLCAFLEVPVPDEPFPRVNDAAEFNRRAAALTTPGPPAQ